MLKIEAVGVELLYAGGRDDYAWVVAQLDDVQCEDYCLAELLLFISTASLESGRWLDEDVLSSVCCLVRW